MNADVVARILTAYDYDSSMPCWPDSEMRIRSYEDWAVLEIVNALMDKPFEHPADIIHNFVLKMFLYFSFKEEVLFRIAAEIGEHILEMFLYPEED